MTGFKILLAFLAAFLVSSMLNWGVAAFILNPWAMPLFDGFMRTGEDSASGLNIFKMTAGFALPQLVACSLVLALRKPYGWAGRAITASFLVGLGGFFGTYTFLSGWGNVNWLPLMGAAVADTVCIALGALVFAFMAGRKVPVG